MQAEYPMRQRRSFGSRLGWFSIGPLSAIVIMAAILMLTISSYQTTHENTIYTGIFVEQVDLSGLTPVEAQTRLENIYAEMHDQPLTTLIDPISGQRWSFTAAELGVTTDIEGTVEAAFEIGRQGSSLEQLQAQFDSWYYGTALAPTIYLDEAAVFAAIDQIAAELSIIPTDAAIQINNGQFTFTPGQVGRNLDKAYTYERMIGPVSQLQAAEIELKVDVSTPQIYDSAQAEIDLRTMLSAPVSFYLQEPIDELDLTRFTLSTDQLREWLRVRVIEAQSGGATYEVFIDEVALRGWLSQYAAQVAREPENARFYFDDPTKELVLVEPHVNGRELDIDGTIAQFNELVKTPNRSVPLIISEIMPAAHSDVTAAELGITELIGERTTWFYDSTANRRHNIARSAANFYGIVVAPGEDFSFNKYLGDVSEEEGYETGLIIYGGQTIEGVGGGVCQVSTTLFQSVFWAGLDVGARLEHAYRVGYYDDGEGPGMDATVFNPLVDFTFTNNTPHYLLLENYYNEEFESLTFKIYSTDIGRTVEKAGPFFDGVQDPLPDEWVYNAELEPGTIRQVDWAAEGGQVTVQRVVRNFAGDIRDQDTFISNYIPWGNVYEYGDGIDPNALPRDWEDLVVKE